MLYIQIELKKTHKKTHRELKAKDGQEHGFFIRWVSLQISVLLHNDSNLSCTCSSGKWFFFNRFNRGMDVGIANY